MNNLDLVSKLPPMLSGKDLEKALSILPEYDPKIIQQNDAARLIALSDIYKIFVPNQMSKEIYSKLYLALLRSLQKKESKLRNVQALENHKAIMQQEFSGIIGGSDSFTILGASGIGKSSAISRAVRLLTKEPIIVIQKPFHTVLPCVLVQCPFDSSVKGLLLEIIRVVDEQLGSKYYITPKKKSQTSIQRKTESVFQEAASPIENNELISISALILRAKNEGRNIISFLKDYIAVEEIRV